MKLAARAVVVSLSAVLVGKQASCRRSLPDVKRGSRGADLPARAGAVFRCEPDAVVRYVTLAGVIEAAFPGQPEIVSGSATTMQSLVDTVATFWQTFATAGRYTDHRVVSLAYERPPGGSCSLGVALARVERSDADRLVALLSSQLNYHFVKVDGVSVAAGPPSAGMYDTGDDAIAVPPSTLYATVAATVSETSSQRLVGWVSAPGLPAGILAPATPGVASRDGLVTGLAGGCIGAADSDFLGGSATVELRRGENPVSEQIVLDAPTLRPVGMTAHDQAFAFFEPSARYTVTYWFSDERPVVRCSRSATVVSERTTTVRFPVCA